MSVLVRSHVSKPSSLPRIHGAEARGAKSTLSYTILRSINSETTLIVQTFAKYGLQQLFITWKRTKFIIVCIPPSHHYSEILQTRFSQCWRRQDLSWRSGMITVIARAASFSSRIQPQPPAISADKMHFQNLSSQPFINCVWKFCKHSASLRQLQKQKRPNLPKKLQKRGLY